MRSGFRLVVLTLVAALVLGAAVPSATAVAGTQALHGDGAVAMLGCTAGDAADGGTLACSVDCARYCSAPAALGPVGEIARILRLAVVGTGFADDTIAARLDPPEPAPPRPHG